MYQIEALNQYGRSIEVIHFFSKPTASQIKSFKRNVAKRYSIIPVIRTTRNETSKRYSEVS